MMLYTEGDREVVRCDHPECSAWATFDHAVKLGWDWFTGALPRTFHFCKKHSTSYYRDTEFKASRLTK